MNNIEKRNKLEELLQSRFFYAASYEIYGGVKGLYDYGPVGSAINENILALWRKWFIFEESMQQIQTSSLTPEVVLKASGHCDNFEDKMVKDVITGDCYRADHLLENIIDELLKNINITQEEKNILSTDRARADDFSLEELAEKLKLYNVVAPDTKNQISDPFLFNLMFATQIGATGKFKGYLRPETAQGTFVNFSRLLEYNGGKLPFATAQIGTVYRNEIAPRSGLLRVREFVQAEIEHFVNPNNKFHNKFHTIKHIILPLYPKQSQLSNQKVILFMTCEDAINNNIVDNQTLCYFLARTYLFLLKIGIHPDKIRFRQHLSNEMAHYAVSCFDAEIFTSYGWIECVGHADRAAYDLSVHSKASNHSLSVFVLFPDGQREIEYLVPELNKGMLRKQYKDQAKNITNYCNSIKNNQDELKLLQKQIEDNTAELYGITITHEILKFKKMKRMMDGENMIPGVIEPSFGIGRIIYCVLEHAFYIRPDAENTHSQDANKRIVLGLKPILAPFCCSILPLLNKSELIDQANKIEMLLKKNNISTKLDYTAIAIGRRYARTDEIGIPYAITIDYDGLKSSNGIILPDKIQTITIRERDSMEQIRVLVSILPQLITDLLNENITWIQAKEKYHVNYF